MPTGQKVGYQKGWNDSWTEGQANSNNKIQNLISSHIPISSSPQIIETVKGIRKPESIPLGARIQNLDLLQKWLDGNGVCSVCNIGQLKLIRENDMEGLASVLDW